MNINEKYGTSGTSGTSGVVEKEKEDSVAKNDNSKLIKKIKNLQLQIKVFWILIAALFGLWVYILHKTLLSARGLMMQ